jgi:hypothetical protein
MKFFSLQAIHQGAIAIPRAVPTLISIPLLSAQNCLARLTEGTAKAFHYPFAEAGKALELLPCITEISKIIQRELDVNEDFICSAQNRGPRGALPTLISPRSIETLRICLRPTQYFSCLPSET